MSKSGVSTVRSLVLSNSHFICNLLNLLPFTGISCSVQVSAAVSDLLHSRKLYKHDISKYYPTTNSLNPLINIVQSFERSGQFGAHLHTTPTFIGCTCHIHCFCRIHIRSRPWRFIFQCACSLFQQPRCSVLQSNMPLCTAHQYEQFAKNTNLKKN